MEVSLIDDSGIPKFYEKIGFTYIGKACYKNIGKSNWYDWYMLISEKLVECVKNLLNPLGP